MPRRKRKQEPGTALLVDGDNVPPDVLPAIVKHLEDDEPVTERRIYRNWRSTKESKVWDRVSKELAFERIDRYNTRREGKNASDIAVAVGAMDLFYQGYRSFCLVSGDTDFVPLIERLRRGGAAVMLIGHIQDPGLLEQISDSYTPHETFGGPKAGKGGRGRRPKRRGRQASSSSSGPAAKKPSRGGRGGRRRSTAGTKKPGAASDGGSGGRGGTKGSPGGRGGTKGSSGGRGRRGSQKDAGPTAAQKKGLETFLLDVFDTATEEGRADDDGWILVDTLGKMVKQKDRGFQPSRYGYPNRTSLSDLFQSCKDRFVVHSRPAKGGNRLVYRVKRR